MQNNNLDNTPESLAANNTDAHLSLHSAAQSTASRRSSVLQNSQRSMATGPEPTIQALPVQNIVGKFNDDYFTVKHNIQSSIKSVHVTCDNKFVVFGAMRKIFFKEIETFFSSRKMLQEQKLNYLGSKMNTVSTMEVQQIECHPRIPSIVASVSGNSLNVWSLQEHEQQTEVFNIINQITSIGWKYTDEKLIATAGGNLVQLFDVRQDKMASKFIMSSKTDHVTWNPCDENVLATSHENEVKIWDVRKINEDMALQTLALTNSGSLALTRMEFDPVFGKLFMTQDQNMIRLFSVDKGKELDFYKCSRKLISAQFLPLRKSSAPGIIALPQRSLNFSYFQIEEGQGKQFLAQPKSKSRMGLVKGKLSDNSASDANYSGADKMNQSDLSSNDTPQKVNSLNLRMMERKGDLVAPRPQIASPEGHHDNDAFAVRLNVSDQGNPASDKIQVISVSSFGDIRIMTLNQPFVEKFYEKSVLCGLGEEQVFGGGQGDQEKNERSDEETNKNRKAAGEAKKHQMTPAEQKRKEIEYLMKLPYVMQLQQAPFNLDDATQEESKDQKPTGGFTLSMKLKLKSKMLGLAFDIEEEYPQTPAKVFIESSYGVSTPLIDAIDTSIMSKVEQKGKTKYASMTSIIKLIYSMLGGQEEVKDADEINFDHEVSDTSSLGEEDEEGTQSKKALISLDNKQMSPGILSSPQESTRKRGFFAYPKTCGFSWNCYGQLMFFANGKYNLSLLDKEKSLKKFTEWPQHYNSILQNKQESNLRKLNADDRERNDTRLIENVGRKGEEAHSSESQNGETSSYSNQLSSDQEDVTSDNSSDEDGYIEGNKIELKNMAMQQSEPRHFELHHLRQIKQMAAQENDDDANFFAQTNSRFQIFVHSFQNLFKPSPLIAARKSSLYDRELKSFCDTMSRRFTENLLTSSVTYSQELSKYWKMVGVALGDLNESKLRIWEAHPLGKGILMKVLRHFERTMDIQQVAMIAALIFGKEQSIYLEYAAKNSELQRDIDIQKEKERLFAAKIATYQQKAFQEEKKRATRRVQKDLEFVQQVQRGLPKAYPDSLGSRGSPSKEMEFSDKKSDKNKKMTKNRSMQNLFKDKKYQDAVRLPNSLQNDSPLDHHQRAGSPPQNMNYFNKLMNSHGNSNEEDTFDQDSFELQKDDDETQNSWQMIKAPYGTPDTGMRQTYPHYEEPKATTSAHHLAHQQQRDPKRLVQSAFGQNKKQSDRNPSDHQTPGGGLRGTIHSNMGAAHSPVESSAGQHQNSPGSPTVGGLVNTNGERVTYVQTNTAKSKRSLASSFQSNRRSVYSMMDYMTHDSPLLGHGFSTLKHTRLGDEPEDLLYKLNKAKKSVERKALESTSANSSFDGLFSSDDDESNDFQSGRKQQQSSVMKFTDPSDLSLMLQSDPHNSMILLKYLKHYSELLFLWGEKELSVQACKIVTDACSLLREYHRETIDRQDKGCVTSEQVLLGTNYFFNWDIQVMKRDWLLSDFLLYSEHSLNYVQEVELREAKEQVLRTPRKKQLSSKNRTLKLTGFQAKPTLPDQDELLAKYASDMEKVQNQPMVLMKCAICDMRPHGLTYFCLDCRHGGCYQHLQQWVDLHRKKRGGPQQQQQQVILEVPCPTGCGCTSCFKNFSHQQAVDANDSMFGQDTQQRQAPFLQK